MKIAIAQINSTVGDLAGNAAKILACAEQAKQQGAQLLLAPELGLCGYPPEDLLLRDGFYDACAQTLSDLAAKTSGIAMVVGHPHEQGGKRYNAASLLRNGGIATTYLKHELPNYSVFDEERYFEHGREPCVFEMEGIRFALNICADVWEAEAARAARNAGARGGVVDEGALARGLREKWIAGAGVDVLTTEPPRAGNPLLEVVGANCIVTPHVAWASQQSLACLAEEIILNIEAFYSGESRNRIV